MTDSQPSHTRRAADTSEFARQLRHGQNMAEVLLWNELKNRSLGGHKFARQFPVGPYFADFLCRSKELVVELDGSQHIASVSDRVRDEIVMTRGYSVVRFLNTGVLSKRPEICETILAVLDGRISGDVISPEFGVFFSKKIVTK
jgi:very-short-patch-repair endonuclease